MAEKLPKTIYRYIQDGSLIFADDLPDIAMTADEVIYIAIYEISCLLEVKLEVVMKEVPVPKSK
jgi:hypothetical protein